MRAVAFRLVVNTCQGGETDSRSARG